MDGAETAFSCKICYSLYDDKVKKPYIISPCSHTICVDCLREILEINSNCPFCKKEIKASINEMKPNYELIDIILTIKNSSNDTKCAKCSENIDSIYFKEKNNNIQFLCKKCAKDDKHQEDEYSRAIRFDDLISNSEKELIYFKDELSHNINKENLKKISRDVVVDYLKKTLCDLIDQKKDQLSSFLDSSDYFNYFYRYNKSLEKILSSREQSIIYLKNNSTTLKNTTKDQVIHNILNVKNQSNDQILNQKIKNFNENFIKEFSKNNFYIHNILSTIMTDIVYHSNIALMNSIKESLREDFGLLDKISEPINLPGIQNFQNNGIQTSYLLTQNFMKNKNKNMDDDKSKIFFANNNNNNNNFNSENHLNFNNKENIMNVSYNYINNSLIKDTYFIQLIGLKIYNHPDINKINKDLKEHFKCSNVSIIKLNDNNLYGTRIFFDNEDCMNKAMNNNKLHKLSLDDNNIKFKKKEAKEGNRLYAIYLENFVSKK